MHIQSLYLPESMVRWVSHQSQRDRPAILSSHPLRFLCADIPHLTAATEKHIW